MKKVLLAVNAEEHDHLCIAMDAHLDHLRGADSAKASGDLNQMIKCAENFYEKCKRLMDKQYEVTLTGSISTTVTFKAKDEEEAMAKAYEDLQKNLGDGYDYVDWLEQTVEEVKA